MSISLTEEGGMAGIGELRQELDRNPKGEHSPLSKAEQAAILRPFLKGSVDGAYEHPEFDSLKNFSPMGKETFGQPLSDYICVLEDRYRDELQCRKCEGKGHSLIECRGCKGTGSVDGLSCPECVSSDFDSPALPKSTGFLPCSSCKGTGQAVAAVTGLVTPTENASQPSTGVVRSLGRSVTEFSLGDRVLYSKFAGVSYEAEGRRWVVMKQTYPIMKIFGSGDVRTRE